MFNSRHIAAVALAGGLVAALSSPAFAQRQQFWDTAQATTKIGHFVVIYLENHSFDNFFGNFPGANGLANAASAPKQVDLNGNVLQFLPPVMNTNFRPATVDTRFPTQLPNAPFLINPFVPLNVTTGDLVHRFFQNQVQIDGGKNDKVAAVSDSGGLSMGYWDISSTFIWKLAQQYTLADNYFQGAFGGSFLNHMWLACACAPVYANAPASMRAVTDANLNVVVDGNVTQDGFAINTIRSVFLHAPSDTNVAALLPAQTVPHIGNRMDAAGVTWKWYAGGMNNALAGTPDPLFQFHHHPFNYMADQAPGTPGFAAHIKDRSDLVADIAANKLPQVTFYKPLGTVNQHPGYTQVADGDAEVQTIVTMLQNSPAWNDMAIFITYDEFGGQYDHVAPPTPASGPVADRWGPGTRVPLIVVSPFAQRGFVDHTQYDTTSILKTIEDRYALPPLGTRDAAVNNLRNTRQ